MGRSADGIASFDWSNAKQLWANSQPMDCEAKLAAQAEMSHQLNPAQRPMVYRNLVKAL